MSCPVQTFVGASCAPSVSSSFSSLSSSSKSSKSSLSSPPLKLLSLSLRMSSLSDQGHHRFHIISNHWLWSPPLYLEVDNPQQLKFLTICSFSFLSFAPYFHVDINSGWSSSWSAVKVKSFHEIPLQAQNYNPAPPGWMKLITPTSTLKLNSRCCQHHIYIHFECHWDDQASHPHPNGVYIFLTSRITRIAIFHIRKQMKYLARFFPQSLIMTEIAHPSKPQLLQNWMLTLIIAFHITRYILTETF